MKNQKEIFKIISILNNGIIMSLFFLKYIRFQFVLDYLFIYLYNKTIEI